MSVMYRHAGEALNDLAKECHKRSKDAGWWEDCTEWLDRGWADPAIATDNPLLGTKIALIHSEVSEMLEGLRKGAFDDHLPHRPMEEVEAADILIRLFDYAGARGMDLAGAFLEKLEYNATRADHKPEARQAEGGKSF